MGLTPKVLQSLGQELGEKHWDGGAKFWASYYKSMQLRNFSVTDSPIRIDPSSVIVEAIDRLKSDPELLESYRSRYSLILIDEFHESDQSQRELLTLIAGERSSSISIPTLRSVDSVALILMALQHG
jgi:superfamily I DNA/RNA helicase